MTQASENFDLLSPLTERELEILRLVSEGLSNAQIASQLFLTIGTIKWYMSAIHSKLGVGSRTQAVRRAYQLGLLSEAEPGASQSSSAPSHNLPTHLTPFIGRSKELAALSQLLGHPHTRLLTILAPGGMGKTRLAVAVAEASLSKFSNGVVFVPLAPLMSSESLVNAIASCVGYQFFPDTRTPRQQLLDFLRLRRTLLVLDNFEHLLDGTALVSDILRTAPQVVILVTSRERLNVLGESVLTLGGMGYSQPHEASPDHSAVQLFVLCARRAQPQFVIGNESDINQICQQVQGMPLAIELAAAWVGTLSLAEIAAEIAQNADFLSTTLQDIPERQRSVRTVFEAAWSRLSDDAQTVFRRLAVFRGGYSRTAAHAVADATLDTLAVLVNRALVWRNPDSGRYQMHELLRYYAEQKLAENSQEEAHARRLHSQYYADLLTAKIRDGDGTGGDSPLEWQDEDNARAGLQYAVDQQMVDTVIAYASALWHYGEWRKWYPDEGLITLFRQSIAVMEEAANTEISKPASLTLRRLTEGLGNLLYGTRHYDEARSAYASALLHVDKTDGLTRARLLRKSGNTYSTQRLFGDLTVTAYQEAEAVLGPSPAGDVAQWWQEWLELQFDITYLHYMRADADEMARRLEELEPLVMQHGSFLQRSKLFNHRVLIDLRRYVYHDLPDETLGHARTALSLAREARDLREIAWLEFQLGFVHLWRTELDLAERQFFKALDLAEQVGDVHGTEVTCLAYFPLVFRQRKRVDEVEHWARRGLEIATQANALIYMGAGHAHIAWVLWRRGAQAEAEQRCRQAVEHWAQSQTTFPFQWLARVPLLAMALNVGRLEEAVGEARRMLDPDQQPLPGELSSLLVTSLDEWEAGDVASAREHLHRFCEQAAERAYL